MARLVSRKQFEPLAGKQSWYLKDFLPNLRWLHPTVSPQGDVWTQFQPMLGALRQTHEHTDKLHEFRRKLKEKQYTDAVELWHSVRAIAPASAVSKWADLMSVKQPHYGAPVLTNALNDISRHVIHEPQLVNDLYGTPPSPGPLDSFLLGHLLSRSGSSHFDFCLNLLSRGWSEETQVLGTTALLESVKMDPQRVKKVLDIVKLPQHYRLPAYLVGYLSANYRDPLIPDLFPKLLPLINPRQPIVNQLLRRVYTNSDAGADVVTRHSVDGTYPHSFYPFLVRTLCARHSSGDEHAIRKLDELFDTVLVKLAPEKPGLLLSMLVARTIATEGVQAAGPVLSRWAHSDPGGVTQQAWLLLFQAFRRMGRPDKCTEVLDRAVASNPRLSLPFLGEYLSFVARFFNIHVYFDTLQTVIPEIGVAIRQLGLHDYIHTHLPRTVEPALVSLPILRPHNRGFEVQANSIHESWLVITYQAVLATVEDMDTALELFHKYVSFVEQSKSATSLRVVDQFVQLLTSQQLTKVSAPRLDTAEYALRYALDRVPLQHATDGKNHGKSVELLCYRLAKSGNAERAIRLLLDAGGHDRVVLKKSVLEPWVSMVPVEIQSRLQEWATANGI